MSELLKDYMQVNGLYAQINTPEALEGDDLNQLPPYDARPFYVVDEYPGCPENWEHGSSKASSYFVPVEAGRGMWFDFTPNQYSQWGNDVAHDVAVVISVQGLNPVTGKPITALNLEQYKDKCPIHDVPFEQDRFCPHKDCKYHWPAQNYIATTTGKHLWIDGFMNKLGEVVQYIITEEEARGVAAQVMGEERVWAIGFAFYKSKNPKPKTEHIMRSCCLDPNSYSPAQDCSGSWGPQGAPGAQGAQGAVGPVGKGLSGFPSSHTISPSVNVSKDDIATFKRISTAKDSGVSMPDAIPDIRQDGFPGDDENSLQQLASGEGSLDMYYPTQYDPDTGEEYNLDTGEVVEPPPLQLRDGNDFIDLSGVPNKQSRIPPSTTKLEIGGGARIEQEVGIDPKDIDYWEEEPAGLIYVNYVSQKVCDQILAKGKREEKKNGPLSGVKVGN
jgi:hypothetical protein